MEVGEDMEVQADMTEMVDEMMKVETLKEVVEEILIKVEKLKEVVAGNVRKLKTLKEILRYLEEEVVVVGCSPLQLLNSVLAMASLENILSLILEYVIL